MKMASRFPEDLLSQLCCAVCKNYLSYFPITIHFKQGTICGRCQIPEGLSIRNETYEIATKNVSFPCCYNHAGCPATLIPEELAKHEENCSFRLVNCPIKPFVDCYWEGLFRDLPKHYIADHGAVSGEVKFQIDSHKPNCIFIILGDDLFINQNCFNVTLHKFDFSIHHIGLNAFSDYNYELTLQDEETKNKVTYSSNFESDIVDRNVTDLFKNREIALPLHGIISITLENKQNHNKAMVSTLMCHFCSNYVKCNLTSCSENHIACAGCNETHRISCTGFVWNNFDLEKKISANLQFYCKFFDNGCKEVGNLCEIVEHEKGCQYGSIGSCPLNGETLCNKSGNSIGQCSSNRLYYSSLISHITQSHRWPIYEKTLSFKIPLNQTVTYASKCLDFSGKIFFFEYRYDKNQLYWECTFFRSPQECETYKYEIYIFDDNRKLKMFHTDIAPEKMKIGKNVFHISSSRSVNCNWLTKFLYIQVHITT